MVMVGPKRLMADMQWHYQTQPGPCMAMSLHVCLHNYVYTLCIEFSICIQTLKFKDTTQMHMYVVVKLHYIIIIRYSSKVTSHSSLVVYSNSTCCILEFDSSRTRIPLVAYSHSIRALLERSSLYPES